LSFSLIIVEFLDNAAINMIKNTVKISLLLFVLLISWSACSRSYQFDPELKRLPVLIISTGGNSIVDEPKIMASLKVFNNFNFKNTAAHLLKKPDTQYKIGIEIRGQSSKRRVKKSYAIEIKKRPGFTKKVSLLGLPPGSDWVLYGPYADKSLIRNCLIYTLSRQMGMPASRFRFVELFLHGGRGKPNAADYHGLYILIEKIKRGKKRINIKKLKSWNNREPEISGGYILKLDKPSPNDDFFITDAKTRIILHYPKAKRITKKQKQWIHSYFNRFEKALFSKSFTHSKRGYQAYLDLDSTINYFLLTELTMNRDSFNYSTFMYKQRNQKIKMGPVWDYDMAMGNVLFNSPSGWTARYYPWPRRFIQDPVFTKKLSQRWRHLRKNSLSLSNIRYQIARLSYSVQEARQRNFKRWPILNKNVWQRKKDYPKTYAEVINFLKSWLNKRLFWLDEHIEKLYEKL